MDAPHRADPTTRPVLRFAPSPNGELHLGHALSALTTDAWARRLGGRFLLRIEDIDPGRSRPEHVDGILQDLAWLGLTWETPVLRQSEHLADYAAAAARLASMGLLYACYATRREIAEHAAARGMPRDPDGAPLVTRADPVLASEETEARARAGAACVMRLDMAAAVALAHKRLSGATIAYVELGPDLAPTPVPVQATRWGDVVLQRKDVPTSYHLSVVVDDARQGVTHVTRGLDLKSATDVHRILQVLLGYPAPLYHHHPLVLDAGGRKLSKSEGARSLRELRQAGTTAADIRRMLGFA